MIVVAPGVVMGTVRPRSGGFPRHSHDEYVISTNLLGRETVELDGGVFEVGTREMTVYNPGQVQSCTSATAPGTTWACLSLYVTAPVASTWNSGTQPEARRPVVLDAGLRTELLSAAVAAGRCGAGSQERRLLVERLEVFFAQVLAAAGAKVPAVAGVHDLAGAGWVHRLRDRLADDLTTAVDLEELAKEVGCSREHLIRSFSSVHGCPPYAWQLGARLARARSELARGVEVARVACAVGFADQAHLTKHFAAAYAITPGRWRTAHLR